MEGNVARLVIDKPIRYDAARDGLAGHVEGDPGRVEVGSDAIAPYARDGFGKNARETGESIEKALGARFGSGDGENRLAVAQRVEEVGVGRKRRDVGGVEKAARSLVGLGGDGDGSRDGAEGMTGGPADKDTGGASTRSSTRAAHRVCMARRRARF